MELLEIVRGCVRSPEELAEDASAEPAEGGGHDLHEPVMGIVEPEEHRVRVQDLKLDRLAVDRQVRIGEGKYVRVGVDIFPIEAHVLHSEGVAVGPSQASPQVNSDPTAVLALVPVFRHAGNDPSPGRVVEEEFLHSHDPVHLLVEALGDHAGSQGPSVPADGVDGMEDQRILREALLHRWKLALSHQAGQHRGLLESAGPALGIQDDLGPLRGLFVDQVWRGTRDFGRKIRLAAEGSQGQEGRKPCQPSSSPHFLPGYFNEICANA